jgi:hypothetical protein
MLSHVSSLVIALDDGSIGMFITQMAIAMGFWVLFFWAGLYQVWMLASQGLVTFLGKRIHLVYLCSWIGTGVFGLSSL